LKEFSSAILESAIDGGHQEVRELTAGAINFAAGTSSKQVKDVTLKLLRLIESWSQDRTNLWTELAGTGDYINMDSVVANHGVIAFCRVLSTYNMHVSSF